MIDIRGALETAVLRSLNGQELHGYAIVKRLNAVDGQLFQTSEGTIYPLLIKLEGKRLIRSKWDARKKVYSITSDGLDALERNISDWKCYKESMSRFLEVKA